MTIGFGSVTINESPTDQSSDSFNHTVSGTDVTLEVAVGFNTNPLDATGVPNTVTDVKYDGVSMTEVVQTTHMYAGMERCETHSVWVMDDPPSGSNLVEITLSETTKGGTISSAARNYTGANNGQGSQTASQVGVVINWQLTLTSDESDSWNIGGAHSIANQPGTPNSPTVERYDEQHFYLFLGLDMPSTGGSDTLSWDGGTSSRGSGSAFELLAVAAPAAADLLPRKIPRGIARGVLRGSL